MELEYEINLDNFQGPLELLYQLIKKNKIEISEISLARITEQYLAYLKELQTFNLDLASEFMVIAAELIEIKAGYLLPSSSTGKKEKDEKDLVQRLRNYQIYKELSTILQEYEEKALNQYNLPSVYKENFQQEEKLIIDYNLEDLVKAYKQSLASRPENKTADNMKIAVEKIDYISEENINVQEKTEEIIGLFKNKSSLYFNNLLKNQSNHQEIVVTLLSILELTRIKRLKIAQEKLFSTIKIVLR